jgi:hypothetical protein
MIADKEWPLEVEDHVILETEIELWGPSHRAPVAALVIPKGTHGMVKGFSKSYTGEVLVEFGGQLFRMADPRESLTLYRRSYHSKRRAEHDASRPKPEVQP